MIIVNEQVMNILGMASTILIAVAAVAFLVFFMQTLRDELNSKE